MTTEAQSAPTPSVGIAADPPFSVSTHVIAGVAVLTPVGRLDAQAMPVLRQAVGAALKVRTPRAVVDLEETVLDDESALVLSWIRTALARHGASITLVTASHESLTWLHELAGDAYQVLPTVSLAVGAGAANGPGSLPRQHVRR